MDGGAQNKPTKISNTHSTHTHTIAESNQGMENTQYFYILVHQFGRNKKRERQFTGKTLKWFAFNTYSCFFFFRWSCICLCKILHIIWVHCETIHILQYRELKCTKKKTYTLRQQKKKKKKKKITKKQAELLHAQPMNNSLEFSMHTFEMWIEAAQTRHRQQQQRQRQQPRLHRERSHVLLYASE